MCARYDNLIPREAYKALFRPERLPQSNFPPRYNIAPTDPIPIIRIDPRDGERELVMARWGLIPGWMKDKPKIPHINARAETVHKLVASAVANAEDEEPPTGVEKGSDDTASSLGVSSPLELDVRSFAERQQSREVSGVHGRRPPARLATSSITDSGASN